ncbi:hypothetical protein RB195_002891 [Necator americanus]|uniref:Uncharacterized protein n=1 Tax=Necator americanus TaxID=51031 RepID=A0ABR1DL48_NECAM
MCATAAPPARIGVSGGYHRRRREVDAYDTDSLRAYWLPTHKRISTNGKFSSAAPGCCDGNCCRGPYGQREGLHATSPFVGAAIREERSKRAAVHLIHDKARPHVVSATGN